MGNDAALLAVVDNDAGVLLGDRRAQPRPVFLHHLLGLKRKVWEGPELSAARYRPSWSAT